MVVVFLEPVGDGLAVVGLEGGGDEVADLFFLEDFDAGGGGFLAGHRFLVAVGDGGFGGDVVFDGEEDRFVYGLEIGDDRGGGIEAEIGLLGAELGVADEVLGFCGGVPDDDVVLVAHGDLLGAADDATRNGGSGEGSKSNCSERGAHMTKRCNFASVGFSVTCGPEG